MPLHIQFRANCAYACVCAFPKPAEGEASAPSPADLGILSDHLLWDPSQWVSHPGMPRRTGRPHESRTRLDCPGGRSRAGSEQTGASAPGPPLSACALRAHFLIASPRGFLSAGPGRGRRWGADPGRPPWQRSAPQPPPYGSLLPPCASWSALLSENLVSGPRVPPGRGSHLIRPCMALGAGSQAQHLVGANRTLFSELRLNQGRSQPAMPPDATAAAGKRSRGALFKLWGEAEQRPK